MTETRVWLCRHAETATPLVFHGAESDEILSPLGIEQAAAAAEWFRPKQIDVVVASRMQRAIATATPIASACSAELDFETMLHERRIGDLCGTSFSLSEGPWIDTLRQWTAGNTSFTTPGAESFDDLRTRLLPSWERVIAKHRGRRIAIVCHGIVVKVLLLSLLPDWDATRWHELGRVANLAVSEIYLASPDSWRSESLLTVPPTVQAISEAYAASAFGKSEA